MQISITAPEEFTRVPWKNGLGFTLELAISEGGTMSSFDWRLSIATVSQDGVFSDFSGYWRNLVLLSGNGIELTHSDAPTHRLIESLDVAKFNGGAVTNGQLIDGEITDFNIMVNPDKFMLDAKTYKEHMKLALSVEELAFVYAPNNDVVFAIDDTLHDLKAGHLLKLSQSSLNDDSEVLVSGKGMIVVRLSRQTV